jgi:uncharacterized lipoprotein NlpE involved in copper resistance
MKKVVTFLLTAAAVLAVGLAGCNNQGDDGTGDDNGLVERFVYVAGEFESVGGKPRTGLARVDSNGYTDMSFNRLQRLCLCRRGRRHRQCLYRW